MQKAWRMDLASHLDTQAGLAPVPSLGVVAVDEC